MGSHGQRLYEVLDVAEQVLLGELDLLVDSVDESV